MLAASSQELQESLNILRKLLSCSSQVCAETRSALAASLLKSPLPGKPRSRRGGSKYNILCNGWVPSSRRALPR